MQLVASPIADPGVLSLILARSHNFMDIGREIFSIVADSRWAGVSYKQKYVQITG